MSKTESLFIFSSAFFKSCKVSLYPYFLLNALYPLCLFFGIYISTEMLDRSELGVLCIQHPSPVLHELLLLFNKKYALYSTSCCPPANILGFGVGILGVGCGGVFSRPRCSSRDRLVSLRKFDDDFVAPVGVAVVVMTSGLGGRVTMCSREKTLPMLVAALGRSSSASEKPPDKYSSSDVMSPAICG